jgi:hypothetical protein
MTNWSMISNDFPAGHLESLKARLDAFAVVVQGVMPYRAFEMTWALKQVERHRGR